jgi:outer membrane cobalamin receptor
MVDRRATGSCAWAKIVSSHRMLELRVTAVLIFLSVATMVRGDEPVHLAPLAVNAIRGHPIASDGRGEMRWIAGEALWEASAPDAALRLDPAFSLFRRTSSLGANPTAQGVSLRGIGPSGASRTLVLLDGVPLNDPFGGWITWMQIPALALAGVEIRHGGGSAAWGNAALGGTIALVSKPPSEPQRELQFEAGTFDTGAATLATSLGLGPTAVRIDARMFSTSGYHAFEPGKRGPVDEALNSNHRLVQAQLEHDFAGVTASLLFRHFDEDRGNGTALQRNASRIDTAGLTLRGRMMADAWQATLYRQNQNFRSFFSAVAPDRATETPANDQFAVPSDAIGAGLTYAGERAGFRFTTGLDYRQVSGETREDYFFTNGNFTRRRFAGGEQDIGGAYLSLEHQPMATLSTLVQLRMDHWTLRNGHRREINLTSGAPTLNLHYPHRDGLEPSGTVELTWQLNNAWTMRGSVYTAFRVPTLNELHRPFRVGNTITEANPGLTPETLRGIETGLSYRAKNATVTLTAFANHLDDAVANITLNRTPTLVTRQRLNVSRLRIQGLEGRVAVTARPGLELETAFLHVDSRVVVADVQPALAGRHVAQVPEMTVTAAAKWQVRPTLRVSAQARWTSAQFEDDENTLTLAAAGTVDLTAEQRLTNALKLTLAVENAFDRAVPVARTAGGPTSYASPRCVRAGVRLEF